MELPALWVWCVNKTSGESFLPGCQILAEPSAEAVKSKCCSEAVDAAGSPAFAIECLW